MMKIYRELGFVDVALLPGRLPIGEVGVDEGVMALQCFLAVSGGALARTTRTIADSLSMSPQWAGRSLKLLERHGLASCHYGKWVPTKEGAQLMKRLVAEERIVWSLGGKAEEAG